MNRYITIFFCVAALSSCKNPLDKEFNRETAEQDFFRIVKLGKIDSSEAEIMSHFMVEHDLIGAQVLEIGASYRDILNESKAYWEKSQGGSKTPTPAAKVETPAYDDVLRVNVVPTQNKVDQSEWSSSLKYILDLENVSTQDIKAIKGRFIFIDAFGERLHEVQYKYLNTLAAHQKVQQPVTFRLLHILSANKVVQFSKEDPFQVKWQADSVIFR